MKSSSSFAAKNTRMYVYSCGCIHIRSEGRNFHSNLIVFFIVPYNPVLTLHALLQRYEKRYMDEAKLKPAEQVIDDKMTETSTVQTTSKTEAGNMNLKSKTSSSTELDLDVFLLGDLGDNDEGPGRSSGGTSASSQHCNNSRDDGDGNLDDDFEKI